MVIRKVYECKLCGIRTHLKTDLKRHVQTKKHQSRVKKEEETMATEKTLKKEPKMNPKEPKMNPNEPKMNPNEPKKYTCEFCKKTYSTNSHMNRHMKKCSKIDLSSNDKVIKYIHTIEKEKKKMMKEIEKLMDKVGTTNNNTITNSNNVNMQQNITINSYGKENLEYLTQDYLTSLLKIPYRSIPNLVKKIHFNPNHPENCNIKIPNRKEKFAKVYNSGSWEFKNKKEVIESIVDNSYNIIECHYDDIQEYLEENKKGKFLLFKEKYNGDGKKDVETETELVILNSGQLIE